jgi:hypothetical protein
MINVFIAVKNKKPSNDLSSAIKTSNDIKILNTFETINRCREEMAKKDLIFLFWDWICLAIRKTEVGLIFAKKQKRISFCKNSGYHHF